MTAEGLDLQFPGVNKENPEGLIPPNASDHRDVIATLTLFNQPSISWLQCCYEE